MAETLRPPVAPNLPVATLEYSNIYEDQYSNVLRLYFNQLDNYTRSLGGNQGGALINFPYGAWNSTYNQSNGDITVAYPVTMDTTDYSNGISVTNQTTTFLGGISNGSGSAGTTLNVTSIVTGNGNILPGAQITGTGVTSNTRVVTQLTSSEATAATHTYVSGGASGAYTFVINSSSGVVVGQVISGTGIPSGTLVDAFDSLTNTVTLSRALTLQAAGTYTFKPAGGTGTYTVSISQLVSASTSLVSSLPSQILFGVAGLYNIQFSLQVENTTNAQETFDVWFRKNGVDIDNSNTEYTIPARKSASLYGYAVPALNFYIDMAVNDYLQIMWAVSANGVSIQYQAAKTSPVRPAIPSAIVTAAFVSNVF